MSDTAKISLRDVHKSFGPKKVLQGVNLDVGPGESVAIIGGSGTGKSVTLKCVLGLLTPEQGSIKVNGVEMVGASQSAREDMLDHTGMLFQGAALFDSLPVWENVAFGLIEGRGMKRKQARDIAIARLSDVGLGPEVANMSPASLSGGMQKRVGLARAIATEPEILFFDEPTTGIDPIMGDVINDLIVKCTRELGACAMTITHDMASARKIADRVAMLYQGKIIWDGPVSEIDNADNPYLQQFVSGDIEGPLDLDLKHL
ncbi:MULTISPECIES: ABC transporter ATP-binding protein [Thalassospira]|mgnify:CR=1 FL=1|jgi:phospholipid/cholesterol/gamma-HCH transport system ATP-binding protein|uniref:ABC transporter ATP-binding protein n=1 Tax=Thalassospira xiamenensis TaxID=220697 RepID=A0ABR5XWD0_9PROT|nr:MULTISPECIES: ATP-binding cassette domain-containing protein [Thalassospira]MBL4839894.1 ATP-binding cassette domain-containing protein [Thalassospira sp.]MBR9779484.1 ATP-binding cassette domain-containing protein [Rhodospirillales bacterium]KZC96728.1 ABC transporter ATP-binding protein [Thalassospira xiamenensis]KZD04352.1 ABC transporter ATP-binding protein [Thalassospira xiamenensis]MBR9818574.1 ATP-binding cassette domain-containing protein [Rhodospirillales bacterium]|tara:strand:- start:2893 stop:3669 length:777 start_codon:yes stop_codon:yes gene_type:complete